MTPYEMVGKRVVGVNVIFSEYDRDEIAELIIRFKDGSEISIDSHAEYGYESWLDIG